MKLQIKTLNQKSLVVDIEDTKTVYDLKKELSLYPDIGVKPELQKLIYAGKILANEDTLSTYNINVKKFLVIMILKQPLGEPPKAKQPENETTKEEAGAAKDNEKATTKVNDATSISTADPGKESEFKTPSAIGESKKDALISQIVGMGYTESDVRKALAASFYNPERAIEYLIEGIPTSASTPEDESNSATDADTMTPFEAFRASPMFQRLRRALQQHPELLDSALQRIGETNPDLLDLIVDNQQEFLSMLLEGSDDEEYDDDDNEDDEDD